MFTEHFMILDITPKKMQILRTKIQNVYWTSTNLIKIIYWQMLYIYTYIGYITVKNIQFSTLVFQAQGLEFKSRASNSSDINMDYNL